MLKRLAILIFIITVLAQSAQAQLTDEHVTRIEQARALLAEVDARTLEEIVSELNASKSPEGNLQILEAVAATYDELTSEIGAESPEDKLSLYDMIRMNVAFVQYGGNIGHGGDAKINRWIRQTLQRHLPDELLSNKKLFYSLE